MKKLKRSKLFNLKRVTTIILMSALFFVFLSLFSVSVQAACYNASETPIPICDCHDLNQTRTSLSGSFALQNNIDCTNTSTWNEGSGFEPIGNSTSGARFTGTFDGQGFNITNLFINRTYNYIGLFGFTDAATIRNVGLVDVTVKGSTYVGGLIGDSFDAVDLINNTFVIGNITGHEYVGGITGILYGRMANSWSNINVSAGTGGDAGGLAGYLDGSINTSYAIGTVYSNASYVAGAVGRSYGVISNSYARVNVSVPGTQTDVAGFVGLVQDGSYDRNYAAGTVTNGNPFYRGGFISGNSANRPCTNNFYDSTLVTFTQSEWACGTGKSTANMKLLATFTDTATSGLSSAWDFANDPNDDTAGGDYWAIDSTINVGYPFLIGVGIGENVDVFNPAVTLVDPADNNATLASTATIIFNCTVTDDNALTNLSLYLTNASNDNFALNQTVVVTGTSNLSNWTVGLGTGIYTWNCLAYDTNGNSDWAPNKTLFVDSSNPVTTLTAPQDTFYNDTWDPYNVTFNCSSTDNVELENISLYITNKTNESFAFNYSANVTGTSNTSNLTLSLENGNYTWSCLTKDAAGNLHWAANRSLLINFSDTLAPNFTAISNQSLGENKAFTYDINATDNYAFDCYSINDTTNFNINCTGYLQNNTALAVGLYWLNITINDTTNNKNFALFSLNITKVGSLGLSWIYPTANTNVSFNSLFNISVNVSCVRADCGVINVDLLYENETNVFMETFEDTSAWSTSTSNSDCTKKGTFDGCDASSSDYDFYISGWEYSGTYALQLDDWDTFNYSYGLWKNITPASDCDGLPCDDYSISFYEHNYGLDSGDYCTVWLRYANNTYIDLWKCNDGDDCDDGTTDASPEANDYVFRQFNLSEIGLSINETEMAIHLGAKIDGTSDYCFFDEFNITGFKTDFTLFSARNQTVNLSENASARVDWEFNATGADNDTQTFSVNASRSEDTTIVNTSVRWNLTISTSLVTSISVAVTSPSNNSFSSDTGLNVNYTTSESAAEACWYANDSMVTNITLTGCANLTNITWTEGQHNVSLWANNTEGNEGETLVSFTIDTINPVWERNKTNVTATTALGSLVYFNITLNDTNSDKYIFSWYNGTVWMNDSAASYTDGEEIEITKTIGFATGVINYTWYFNDSAGNTNQTLIWNATIAPPDEDNDGLPDSEDTLFYNESNVTTSGVTLLNITVGGNATNYTYGGYQEILFHDQGNVFINFSHNFTKGKLDLRNITITKTSTSLIVNLSGQFQGNKTLYIDDDSFATLCVKDAEVGSIDEVSSGCNGANETDLTSCIGGTASKNNITCIDEGSRIKIENLQHSAIRATQPSSSSSGGSGGASVNRGGGGGGGSIWNRGCTTNTDCKRNQYCEDYSCYNFECTDVTDCNQRENEVCRSNVCVKLFDIFIDNFPASVMVGEFFTFTYGVKGMADINDDVEVHFRIEKDGEIVTSGHDTIFVGSYEELAKSAEILLPSTLESGVYTFYVQLVYGEYTVSSHRVIEVTVDTTAGTATLSASTSLNSRVKGFLVPFFTLMIIVLLSVIIYTQRKHFQRTTCVKLFGIEIKDFEATVLLGTFFEFTYWIKDLENIKKPMGILYWLEKDGKKIITGHDALDMQNLKEKTGTAELLMPAYIHSGMYTFGISLTHDGCTVHSQRKIHIDADPIKQIARLTSIE